MNSQTQKENQRDWQLLQATAAGDKEAFSALYRRYYPLLTRFAYRYLQQIELIEEVVNDTLLTIWQKAGEFRGESRVSTWMMGIAMRKCWEAARKQNKHDCQDIDEVPEPVAPVSDMERLDSRQQIDHAMQHLSAEQRSCVELAYQSGYTCEEIGQIMQCPTNTVKTRLFHARKIFKKVFGHDNLPFHVVESETS